MGGGEVLIVFQRGGRGVLLLLLLVLVLVVLVFVLVLVLLPLSPDMTFAVDLALKTNYLSIFFLFFFAVEWA